MGAVDIHTHFIPAFVQTDGGRGEGVFGVRYEDGWMAHPQGFRYPVQPEYNNPQAKLALMDEMDLEISALSISPTMFFYEEDPGAAVDFAIRANDALAEMCERNPRLMGYAHLPLQDAAAAAEELERCIVEHGFVGTQIGTSYNNGKPLDGDELAPVFEVADRHSAAMLLHPYYVGPKPGLEPFYFTNSLGNPIDTTVAAARLIHAGTLDRWQNVKIGLVHGGGFLPYQVGRLDHAFSVRKEPREAITRDPSDYLDRFYMDTITHGDDQLQFLADFIGLDRLILGTDLPFDMGVQVPLERIRRTGLSEEGIEKASREFIGIAG